MNNVSSSDITVTLGFTHVTTSDSDFTTTPVVVTFPSGTISATATVSTTADPLQEADETFIVKITATTGLVGDASDTAIGTIVDDDSHPVAVDDDITTNEDVLFQGNVALNDATNATTGNVWSVAQTPDHGTVVMSTDGKFTYTPAANYNGTDAFSYKLCDAEGDCDEAVVSVTIVPVDDKPVATDDQINFYLDGILNGKVADNDVPSGDGNNIWAMISQPTNGTISFSQDGSFIYTPNLNFLGSDSFTYRLCDVDGDCDEATVTIVIEDVVLPNQVLTPNGDEDNETFIIKGIQFYPQNNLTVYNRWGNKVYQKSGYNNEWKGESSTSKVGSSALPVGTYFFVLEYGKQRHKTGYVYLDR
jgi:gliding motility-associated-like protein